MAGRFRSPELALLDRQIATFELANPDIRVEIVSLKGNSQEQHETIIRELGAGDTSTDIYVVEDTWLAELADKNLLLPLDDYVDSNRIDMGSFFPSAVQANTIDGRLVALPWTIDGGLLYYRRDLLEKYGYDPPITWADLQQVALDIMTQEGLPHGFVWQGAAYESLTSNTLEFLWAHGGEVLDETGHASFDSPEAQAALEQMSAFVTSGASPQDITTYTEGTAMGTFREGQAVFMRNWSYAWESLQEADSPLAGQTGVSHLPASALFEEGLSLSAHSLYPEQAFRWMAFLTSYDQLVQWTQQTGQPTARETVYHDPEILAAEPFFQTLGAALSATQPRPRAAAYPSLSEAIYTEVNRMLAGEQGAEITAANIQRRIESILQQQ
jgi:multiple sugar transport system substrate-binding protein